jgi:hypothetical protein
MFDDQGTASFRVLGCWVLRLRERFVPSLKFSSLFPLPAPLANCASPLVTGEYGRGVVEGEKDETCKSMTNSCVELVRATILARRSGNSACEEP